MYCDSLLRFVLRGGLLLLAGLSFLTPALAKPQAKKAEPARPVKKMEPYIETIPRTLVKFEMIPVRGGSIETPDPARPGARKKAQAGDFWIGKFEVTWDEFDIYLYGLDLSNEEEEKKEEADAVSRPSKPYGSPDRGFGHEGYPAISVTYHAAERYCHWLSVKTGKKYRLPTEVEWEYACRARILPSGPLARAALDKVAWHWDNSDDKTHPVGKKEPNAWGLYDMLGNAGEWCKPLQGTPVLCGGSYRDSPEKISPSARQRHTPGWQSTDPQNPKSKWWLSDGPFAGLRVLREE